MSDFGFEMSDLRSSKAPVWMQMGDVGIRVWGFGKTTEEE
jgi:hypothetical protein